MDTAFFLGSLIGLLLMLAWIGALIWAAVQDGRIKRR
jgi:hypothetical protein